MTNAAVSTLPDSCHPNCTAAVHAALVAAYTFADAQVDAARSAVQEIEAERVKDYRYSCRFNHLDDAAYAELTATRARLKLAEAEMARLVAIRDWHCDALDGYEDSGEVSTERFAA